MVRLHSDLRLILFPVDTSIKPCGLIAPGILKGHIASFLPPSEIPHHTAEAKNRLDSTSVPEGRSQLGSWVNARTPTSRAVSLEACEPSAVQIHLQQPWRKQDFGRPGSLQGGPRPATIYTRGPGEDQDCCDCLTFMKKK